MKLKQKNAYHDEDFMNVNPMTSLVIWRLEIVSSRMSF
jgi:hypothetical protein